MTNKTTNTETLPEMCYVRHITTGETVVIRRGEMGYLPVDTKRSPECLNGRLARVPTEDEIAAMRHGSLMGWEGPGVDPVFWRRQREHRT